MKELLTYIVQNLVEHPDEVSVTEREADGETVFEVRVADGDMGKVIGRQGRIVKQIRILMKAVAQKQGKKVSVEIIDSHQTWVTGALHPPFPLLNGRLQNALFAIGADFKSACDRNHRKRTEKD